ncbi:MAG: M48 family metalloprotease [Candidatus Dormibacteria bacterium]
MIRPPAATGRPAGIPLNVDWLLAGMRRRWGSALVTLFCTWSGLWLAVWLVAVTAILDALLTFTGLALTGGAISSSPGGGAVSAAGGVLSGVIGALVTALAAVFTDDPLQLATALALGVAISLALLGAMIGLEPWLLRVRGYRRMSRREAVRIVPLLDGAARDLRLGAVPAVLMDDGGSLTAITAHCRHLVVSRALCDEIGDEPLGAVITHGLWHWAAGDAVGGRLVLACGLPLILLYEAGAWLSRRGGGLVAAVGWTVLWPAWVLVRLVIRPVMAAGTRRQEYGADAAVAATGRGPALHQALTFLGEFEPGRSGWDQTIAATHPPRELRLEALEPAAELSGAGCAWPVEAPSVPPAR